MNGRVTRSDRVAATRETILVAAERLFAEHGLAAVSNRQISQEAGQGNNTAVTYHFGSKAGLVRAIVRKHTEQVEEIRMRMVLDCDGSTRLRDWIACMVEPFAQHLADLGTPTWYGRFSAQAMSDETYREAVSQEALNSPSLLRAGEGLHRCLPDLPIEVRRERQDMARQLMVHMIAERERALAEGGTTPRDSWHRAAVGLTDALTGLWLAPVTEVGSPAAPETVPHGNA
ncbi:TetR/AcrR family transcriptional regulator [Nocardiopsis sp. MG754419]|uniref:TetR/AcrR family transcriptional regulator n=1 Tax=Nocardiopsis sp. MG754419 TaxID=2259865 RepID=UPI001BA529A4|nr:TetR/AcrR family transcriptional regulator [Nocardiopsis sp. MG754419]MBR8740793.1 TetR family transcriptional regulator [Nocardiopsis sp. MG754419]